MPDSSYERERKGPMSHRLHPNRVLVLAWIALAGATLGGRPVSAQTYVSTEPIPSQDIVGSANLAKILNLGYPNLELWSQRLLNDCHMVENVITALSVRSCPKRRLREAPRESRIAISLRRCVTM